MTYVCNNCAEQWEECVCGNSQTAKNLDASANMTWADIKNAEIQEYEQNPRLLLRLANGIVLIGRYEKDCAGQYDWFADNIGGGFPVTVKPTHYQTLPSGALPSECDCPMSAQRSLNMCDASSRLYECGICGEQWDRDVS